MKSVFLPAFLVALGSVSFAFGDVNAPTDLSENLKKARLSLAKMGLTTQRAGSRMIGGKSGVAVHRAAIIEEKGKSFVVVLDENDPSKSEKIQVRLGDKSGDYIHAENGVTPGDYLVVRVEELTPSRPSTTTPALVPAPVKVPVEIREPKIAKRISPPQMARREPTPSNIFRRGVPIATPKPTLKISKPSAPKIPPPTLKDDRFYLGEPTPKSDPKVCEICKIPHFSENNRSPLFEPGKYDSFSETGLHYDNGFDYPRRDSPRKRDQGRPIFNETPGFDPFFLYQEDRYIPEYRPFDSGCNFDPRISRGSCSWGH
jgi:hypothetical protein